MTLSGWFTTETGSGTIWWVVDLRQLPGPSGDDLTNDPAREAASEIAVFDKAFDKVFDEAFDDEEGPYA